MRPRLRLPLVAFALSSAILALSCTSGGSGGSVSAVTPGSTATPSGSTPPQAPPPPSTPPGLAVTPGAFSGAIPVSYVLSDPSSTPTDIAVSFSLDSGASWFTASQGPGSDGTSALATSPTGVAHTFVWDSLTDLGPVLASGVLLAISPSGQAFGLSPPFDVDDRAAPSPPTATGRDWTKAPAIVEIANATRVLQVADVHGDYATLANLLARTGVIAGVPAQPSAPVWNAGSAVFICTGDLVDKGTDSLDVIAFLRALQGAAAAAGGQVIVTMGNHEAEFLATGGTGSKGSELEAELTQAGISPQDVAAGKDAPGIGAWLRALPFAAKVGDWFFCHAGNTGGLTLDQLRQALQKDVDANGFAANTLVGASSMLEAKLHPAPWWEGLATASGTTQAAADQAQLASTLAALGAKHLVIGHQPVAVSFSDGSSRAQDAMFANFNGLVFLTDTGMSTGVDSGLGAVLQVDGAGTAHPVATALFADGTSQVLLR